MRMLWYNFIMESKWIHALQINFLCKTQDAIKAESFHGEPYMMEDGDLEKGFAKSDSIIEGMQLKRLETWLIK